MKKISASKKIRRNILDNVTRIAAEGLAQGDHSSDILLTILAEIHGQAVSDKKKLSKKTKKKVGRPKKPGPKPKNGRKKPGPKPKNGRKKPGPKPKKWSKAAKLALKKTARTLRNPNKPPHGYIKKAVARGQAKGLTSREILTALKKKYPDCKTTINTISFYKKKAIST